MAVKAALFGAILFMLATLVGGQTQHDVVTIGDLPTCTDIVYGKIFVVNDATDNLDCTVGGGTEFVECFCDPPGAIWTPFLTQVGASGYFLNDPIISYGAGAPDFTNDRAAIDSVDIDVSNVGGTQIEWLLLTDSVGDLELDFIDGDTPADEDCVTIETGGANGTLEAQPCGSGDSARVEDGDNGATFTAMSDLDFEDSGDINFVRAAGPPDQVTGIVRANSVALTTDTTGNYVASATANEGLVMTGTEGGSLGIKDCAATESLRRNAGDTDWECFTASAGGGDSLRVEDGDNTGTFTAATDADFDDSGDINFILNTAAAPDIVTASVRADSVALTTDTTGDYVNSITANQGILLTGTEGASVGLIDCAENQILKNTGAGGAAWTCSADDDVPEAGDFGDAFDLDGNGTIDNDAVTYAKMQNISTTDRLLGLDSAAPNNPEELTVHNVLDWLGTGQGAIIYRDAAVWKVLNADLDGEVLTTHGIGANPTWEPVSGGSGLTHPQVMARVAVGGGY